MKWSNVLAYVPLAFHHYHSVRILERTRSYVLASRSQTAFTRRQGGESGLATRDSPRTSMALATHTLTRTHTCAHTGPVDRQSIKSLCSRRSCARGHLRTALPQWVPRLRRYVLAQPFTVAKQYKTVSGTAGTLHPLRRHAAPSLGYSPLNLQVLPRVHELPSIPAMKTIIGIRPVPQKDAILD